MDQLKETGRLIVLKKETEYAKILKQSFLDLNLVAAARKRGCYSKKYFKCCIQLKHQIFKKDPRFKQPGTCVVSGIKRGDGMQRRIWLTQLANGKQPYNHTDGTPAFYHLHKSGQLYYYPFRDYRHVELPNEIILEIRKLYPDVEHSGCACCPILLLFQIKSEYDRYEKSLRFYKKLVKSGQLHPSRDLQKYTGIQINTLDDYEVL
jgi:hypothetical protein